MTGRHVMSLAKGQYSGGQQIFDFDLTEQNEGVYFCTMKTRLGTISTKLLLIKP